MPLPILSVSQIRDWEKATWTTGKTETEVIEKVGHILGPRVDKMASPNGRILILAGKGHNGDDARSAIPHIKAQVRLVNVTNPEQDAADLREALLNFPPDLIIDALFGIGLNRPLNDAWIAFINAINEMNIPVLSVDVPSGLNAETGKPEGAAIRATVTLTLGAVKAGLISNDAGEFVGRLEVAPDIGLVPCSFVSDLNWITAADFHDFPPRRPVTAHKGSFGHAIIVAGSVGYHGAAVLATRGALRAQPGLVTLYTQENTYYPVASQLQAAMVHPWRPAQKLPEKTTAILFGPGLAAESLTQAVKQEMRNLWRDCPLPMIVDASALDWLSTEPAPKSPRVITPHPGEAARLLKTSSEQIQSDRVRALRELSRRYGNCWVVLKGHQTLVGRSNGPILVNSSGNPFLAQGGSGDVLSGYIAGLLAQPPLQSDVAKTISFAVWQHGATADFLSKVTPNWGIEELVLHLGNQTSTNR